MSSPLATMFMDLQKSMSGSNEYSTFISNRQRERILLGLVEAYYSDVPECNIVFDTNRQWCSLLPVIAALFPRAHVLCCVRSPAWILDSVELHVQKNALQPTKMFGYDPSLNVYSRVERLMSSGFVGTSLNNLRQAWFGDFANRLVAIRYESLTSRPGEVLRSLYDVLGSPSFAHDFERLDYGEPEFDINLGLPDFHRVAPKVEAILRATILPPDLFVKYDRCFWNMPGQNPKGVQIL
jgi:sulfotransferase